MSLADDFAKDVDAAGYSQPTKAEGPFSTKKTYGTPAKLLDNLMQVESSGNPAAVNPATGATGAYQFLPSTVSQLAKQGAVFDPNDAQQSRAGADYYVQQLVQQHGGDYRKALAAYGGFKDKDPTAYVNKVLDGVDLSAPAGQPTQSAPSLADQFDADVKASQSSPQIALSAQKAGSSGPAPSSSPTQDALTGGSTFLSGLTNPTKKALGVGEFAAQAATGTLASAAGGLKGLYDLATGQGVGTAVKDIKSIQDAGTYQPRSEMGQALSRGVGTALGGVNSALGTAGGAIGSAIGGQKGQLVGQSLGEIAAPVAMTLAGGVKPIGSALDSLSGAIKEIPAAPKTLAEISQASSAPEGSSALTIPVAKPRYKLNADGSYEQIATPSSLSPVAQQIQQTKTALAQTNPGISDAALQRHAEAQSIGVNLTAGQASGDATAISNEMNLRGKSPELMQTITSQNPALINALDTVRTKVAPDVTVHGSDIGQQLVDSYKTRDAQAQAAISANYKKLEEANGGQFPLNGGQFVNFATQALKDKNVSRFLPGPVQGILDDLKGSGNMTFNDFENYRTILAQQQRAAERAGDGTAAYAVQTVRNSLENIPMSDAAAGVKQLADTARASAAQRFKAIESDPAYKAAVNDDAAISQASPLADKFVQNYIVNGRAANVAKMSKTLSYDPAATQAMKAGLIDNLKSSAGIDLRTNTGNLSQAGLNKAIGDLGSKAGQILGDDADTINTIGNVARYTQVQPKGSFVNNSNTFAGMVGASAQGALEHAADIKTLGGYSMVKNLVTAGGERRALAKSATPLNPPKSTP